MPQRSRKPSPTGKIDRVTKKWLRNQADVFAADNGCRFDEARADHVLEFCESECRLYEGHAAGQLVRLMPWQIEDLSRLFGWVRWSEDWGRWVRRFTVASIWIPKKNGKSPTAAMVGLYLLTADGELGQKVFSTAKDGKQAKIVHTHAVQMVSQSPRLSVGCKINATTGRIAYLPTTSYYDIVSGDNIKGQEGLNGSVIIDETHVVDDRLARVLEYAGASRSEPLRFEVSTAGNNLDGYGKRQQDYGRLVNAGTVRDDSFYCSIYEAPQKASDRECGTLKVWREANPAFGHLIRKEEMRSSYQRAKRTKADLATFKMYRLNIWQFASNPWLSPDQWSECKAEFDAAAISHLPAVVAIDLSKTTDMTAAVRMGYDRETETAFIEPHFWLPAAAAQKMAEKVPWIFEWADQGHVTLTEGDVIDYSAVERYLKDLHEQYPYQELIYDPLYAEEITQRIEAQTGVERVQFRQSNANFWGPTQDFERLVLAGRMRHSGHPVLAWQIGHAEVKEDNQGNKRVVKPRNKPHLKVDGVVAGIMATARSVSGPQQARSYYEDHDPEFV